MELPK